LRERRAKDDEVGIPNGGKQIGGDEIRHARFFTVLQAGGTADETRGPAREFPASNGQPERAAEQTNADDG
jgi:hypothetical protein